MPTPHEYAQIVLACLNTQITDGPFPIPGEKICLRFGERVDPTIGTAEDECCTGLAWVRVASVDNRVDPDDPGQCIHLLQRLTLELGTARCIAFGDTQRGATCDQWTEAALKMDSDFMAMQAAVCCARAAMVGVQPELADRVRQGRYEPFGPDGNCLRGTMQMTIDYDCGC